MPVPTEPDDCVQQEVRAQATTEPIDEQTAREALELELLEEGASEEGEHIGEHVD